MSDVTHLRTRRLSLRRPSVAAPILDPRPPHPVVLGSYGDDFDAQALDPAWGNTSGAAPVAALDLNGPSWASLSYSTIGATYRSAPSGDFTVTAAMQIIGGFSTNLQGLMVLDGSGNGVGLGPYSAPDGWLFTTVTAGSYGGSFTQVGSDTGVAAQQWGALGWYRIIKSGTTYTAQVATDRTGTAWSSVSSSFTGPATATRLAIGRFQSNSGVTTVQRIDWIDVA